MGTYTILLNALAEDGRLDEVEELWTKLFTENLESTPRNLFDKMMAIYHHKGMHDKMFEVLPSFRLRPILSIIFWLPLSNPRISPLFLMCRYLLTWKSWEFNRAFP